MKTIGIVGGVAWPSTMIYYQAINEGIAKRLGGNGLHCAKLVLAQTDFEQIERYQRDDHWDLVGEILATQGNKLKLAGADFFLIACNTVHTAHAQVQASVDLPFLHIVDPAARKAIELGSKRVGLLGSRYTMRGTYFVDRLKEKHGLDVLVAQDEHETNVNTALYTELAKGIFAESTRMKFKRAIDDLVSRGAETVILGCTEFGMLVKPEDSPVPLIDTSLTHADAAVELALASGSASGMCL